jgi:hypothetical protein
MKQVKHELANQMVIRAGGVRPIRVGFTEYRGNIGLDIRTQWVDDTGGGRELRPTKDGIRLNWPDAQALLVALFQVMGGFEVHDLIEMARALKWAGNEELATALCAAFGIEGMDDPATVGHDKTGGAGAAQGA